MRRVGGGSGWGGVLGKGDEGEYGLRMSETAELELGMGCCIDSAGGTTLRGDEGDGYRNGVLPAWSEFENETPFLEQFM